MEEKYVLTVNNANKQVEMKVNGTFSPEDVKNFMSEYENIVKKVKASDYILNIDCTGLNTLHQDMIPSMEGAFKMYKATGFKKVNLHIKSAILKMQLNRLLKSTQLENAEVISA